MPALEAFGRKWRVGSDDFVFPYASSILIRFLWSAVIGYVLVSYDEDYECDDERLLKVYLGVLVGINFCVCLVELSIVLISARGTIANPAPRKELPVALYIQLVFFVLEFIWDIVGVLWAFDPSIDCSMSHSMLILTRGILIWNLFSSAVVGGYLILRIGICRLCCRGPPKKLKYESLLPSTSFGGRSLSIISSEGLARHHRQRRWQWRLEWILRWMTIGEGQQNVFTDVSATLTDAFSYFRGYVPSDVLAGMTLLALEHKESQNCEWDEMGEVHHERKELDFESLPVCRHFNRAVHYMKFAEACYGWKHYLHSTNLLALPSLLPSCKSQCCTSKRAGDVELGGPLQVQGDSCGWQMKSLRKITGLVEKDILYASFSSEIFCPAFYVAYDHKEEAVIVAIRGTLAIKDALTDLSAEPGILKTSEEGDIYGHRGMIQSAHAVQLKLEAEGILERAFEEYENYRLVLVGHSLGAGVAAILAIILKPQYPKLHCFSYSPPGSVISMEEVPESRAYITSIVVGNDFIPRLSQQSFDTFCERILHCIQTCHQPKYQIFLNGLLNYFGVCKPVLLLKNRKKTVSELIILEEPLLNTNYEANSFEEEDLYDVVADTIHIEKVVDPVTGKAKQQQRARTPLFLPGRIIHITQGPPRKKCCGILTYRPLKAYWAAQSEFSELVIEKNIVKHHLPSCVSSTLKKLQKENKLTHAVAEY